MKIEFIGKWFKKFEFETINIFDDGRMKISFESSGYYNVEPNCVYEKDDFLCYEINDEEHRRVYTVKYEDNKLIGTYTQQGDTTEITYEKISEIPEYGEFKYIPPKMIVPGTEFSRIDILKKYAVYSDEKSDIPHSYDFTLNGSIPEILNKYSYYGYIKKYNEQPCDEMAFSLLNFVCDNFQHKGNSGMPKNRKVKDIIEFCINNNNEINCRGLSILLSALLRLNGIKAAFITCKPYEEPFDDCHVVVDCLLPSGQRVMLDPTYRLYLKDRNHKYISLKDLRKLLINGDDYYNNETASYNGHGFNISNQREYMIKNTFRFSRSLTHYDGCEEGKSGRIELIPLNYPIQDFTDITKSQFIYNDNEFWNLS